MQKGEYFLNVYDQLKNYKRVFGKETDLSRNFDYSYISLKVKKRIYCKIYIYKCLTLNN